MLWHSSFCIKTKIIQHSHLQCQLYLLDCLLQHRFFKMKNSLFIPLLDEFFNLLSNVVCQLNYWVYTTERYRSTSILGRVDKAFFNYYQFNTMTYMPDETILARMMTTQDLEFERALHYLDEMYESDNEYGLPSEITKPICLYSIFTTEASFHPADFTTAQCPSHLSLSDVLEAYHSEKGSAST